MATCYSECPALTPPSSRPASATHQTPYKCELIRCGLYAHLVALPSILVIVSMSQNGVVVSQQKDIGIVSSQQETQLQRAARSITPHITNYLLPLYGEYTPLCLLKLHKRRTKGWERW